AGVRTENRDGQRIGKHEGRVEQLMGRAAARDAHRGEAWPRRLHQGEGAATRGATLPLATKLRRDGAKQRHDDNKPQRQVEVEVKPQIPLLQSSFQVHEFPLFSAYTSRVAMQEFS